MQIIIGLGNPGEKYAKTRHNAGFIAADLLAQKTGQSWQYNKKFNAFIIKTNGIVLAKPMNFMNNSGRAVQSILSYYKLLPKKLGFIKTNNSDLSDILFVIHDDLDIELGKYKISIDSRSAGHNGVQSIIDNLKTKNFKRFRIGIKTPLSENMPAEKFVLQKFSPEELAEIEKILPETIKDIMI